MRNQGVAAPSGALGLRVIRKPPAPEIIARDRWVPPGIAALKPRESGVGAYVRAVVTQYLPPHVKAELLAKLSRVWVMESALAVRIYRGARRRFSWRDWAYVWDVSGARLVADLGVVSEHVVTDAGVEAIVDAFQNTVELETFKFHGLGTDNTAENQTDTALGVELTTQLNPDNTRATGSTTEGATANVFRTVGTNTFDASVALVEHGIFTSATVGAGTLLDRSVFAVNNLGDGESMQTTYDLTVAAGG